jgi:hypothetical protein
MKSILDVFIIVSQHWSTDIARLPLSRLLAHERLQPPFEHFGYDVSWNAWTLLRMTFVHSG